MKISTMLTIMKNRINEWIEAGIIPDIYYGKIRGEEEEENDTLVDEHQIS